MIDEDALENALVNRISETFAKIDVDAIPLPDSEAEADAPFARGRICVAYHSSEYTDPEYFGIGALQTGVQYQTVDMEISMESRKRRDNAGIKAYLNLAKRLLWGFRPIGDDPVKCGKLFPVQDHHVSYVKGTWTHALIMRFVTQVTEPADFFTSQTTS